MLIDVKVPAVGESIQEAMIHSWKKSSEAWVERDEVLCELETDKATVEVVAASAGLFKTLVPEGKVVKVGTVIAQIDTAAEKKAGAAPVSEAKPKNEKVGAVATLKKDVPLEPGPAVQRMKSEMNLDLSLVQGSGRGGRVTKGDIIEQTPPQAGTPVKTTEKTSPHSAVQTVPQTDLRSTVRKPMSILRRRIAERLKQSQNTAAILTTFNEIDMTAVTELRAKYKDAFEKKHGLRLGFMSFFLRASIEALASFPDVNAFIEGDELVYHNYSDIGVAVSTDKGLIVPVLRNVERMSLLDIERAIAFYAEKARNNKISIDDLSGGTFTVSNGGVFGSLLSTPILNPPQSGILGMHKTQMRPIVLPDGKIEARPMMYVALSYDHRIIDGKEAVGFLIKVKECVEDPSRMLLGV
ncbi:MAG: 2-oxoglutarate dehydrogenase complex dihydrolipoyllysine-residue succinyltransferase [Oligoflexales bacterium]|nr:2-oxoglutarate dehydrogenase complex dihydrolipoyllysine-residue succinyltransferase [Oligoflexales bacterium]